MYSGRTWPLGWITLDFLIRLVSSHFLYLDSPIEKNMNIGSLTYTIMLRQVIASEKVNLDHPGEIAIYHRRPWLHGRG